MSRVAALLIALGWSVPASAADWLGAWDPPLTTAKSVRNLTHEQAAENRRVNLTGVVTFARGGKHDFWVQDDTAGVRVTPLESTDGLSVGDRVEVAGATNADGFAPGVTARAVAKVGRGEFPSPRPFDLTTDDARELDGQWVEASVQLRSAYTEVGVTRVEAYTRRGASGTLLVRGEQWAKPAKALRDVAVTVRGVCVATARHRAMSGPPSVYLVELPDPAAAEEPGGPDHPQTVIAKLLHFAPQPHPGGRRAVVTGVVTAAPFPGVLAVQDATGGATVWTESPRTDVAVGTRVEVAGLLRIDGRRVGLTRAEVKVLGPAPLPEPAAIGPGELAGGFRDANRVRLTARVDDVRAAGDGWTAVGLVEEGVRFQAFVRADSLAGLEPGSRVEVTGVPLEATPDGKPGGLALFLRDAGSLVVVAPPPRPPAPPEVWWTGRRVAYLAGGFLAVSAVGLTWVVALRVQVRRAARAIERKHEEAVKLEKQLQQGAKLESIGRLAGGIAHDFNNLLTVINGCAELLADETPADRPHLGELVNDIRRAGDRAAELTGRLLTFSRKREVPDSAIDINDVVIDTARLLDRVIGEHIRIETRLAPNLPPIRGNTGLLNQVIMNLAVNARDAMPAGGTVTIATELVADSGEVAVGPDVPVGAPPQEYVRLVVADTGAGMPDEVKARLFEPFFTTKAIGKGTGLGLPTVYGIVQTLRGRIRVESELGRGTTFVIEFRPHAAPLSDAVLSAPPPVGQTPAPLGALRPLPTARLAGVTVLVVEDNELVRELVVNGLSSEGATVLAAARPDHALRVLSAHAGGIDVLVTDVVMPGMSGLQLAERVWVQWPGVRVVFMSGYTADEVLRQGVHEDQVEFVQKPFTPDQLTARLLRVLGRPV